MIKKVTFIFILFITLVILIANTRGHWFAPLYAIPMVDKFAHFFLMGVLSFLINLTLNGRLLTFRNGKIVLWGSFVVLIIVTLEEVSQLWISSRTFSLLDLTADFLGIYLGGKIAVSLLPQNNLLKKS